MIPRFKRGPRRGVRKRGPLLPIVVPERVVRAATRRKYEVAEPELDYVDAQEPRIRALIRYFGTLRVARAMRSVRLEDVPRALGDETGFDREWGTFLTEVEAKKRPAGAQLAWSMFKRGSS